MYVRVKNNQQIESVAALARKIWTDHFGPMVGRDAIDTIIEKVQSKAAILEQMRRGDEYYLIESGRSPVGYFAFRLSEPQGELFISKLYIRSSERQKGHGARVMDHLEHIGRAHHLSKLRLTVFQKNASAIRAYEKMGFTVKDTIVRDLGDGVLLKDFEMEKKLS